MIPGASVDRHHWVPKSQGGRQYQWMHKICHRFLHANFSEIQLARQFFDPEMILSDPKVRSFVAWVRKRPPEYLDWPKDTKHG